jgi:lysophospholipase L1-like esterase
VWRLIIIGSSIIGIFSFFWKETHEFMLLVSLNKNLLGIITVWVIILTISALSSKHFFDTLSNYTLLASSCFMTLLFAEIGCRIIAYYNVKLFENLKHTTNMPYPGEVVPLGRMIRLSKNPRIIYEFIPNVSVVFQDQPVSINPEGFRGKSIPLHKNARSVRIVGLGDSGMFGWGVKDHEVYLALLSESLNTLYPEFSWEIVNTAVPGYNTIMEVETLKEKGLQYLPDIVIIEYVGNDLDLPNFIREKENYFTFKKSFLKQYLSRLTRTGRIPENLISAPFNFEKGHYVRDSRRIPEQYKDMVGIEAYRRTMQELQSLSKENNFDVVVISSSFPAFVRDICEQLKFRTIEVLPTWETFANEHNISDDVSVMQLSEKDPHPSVIGHQVIANAILKYFTEHKVLQRLRERD